MRDHFRPLERCPGFTRNGHPCATLTDTTWASRCGPCRELGGREASVWDSRREEKRQGLAEPNYFTRRHVGRRR
jgi:hypothetical protein